jgi:hypothetical protein
MFKDEENLGQVIMILGIAVLGVVVLGFVVLEGY